MSLVGSLSGGKDNVCEQCGDPYGSNTVHLDADFTKSGVANMAYTGFTFGNPQVVLVCDRCLFSVLDTAFRPIVRDRKGEAAL